MTFNQIVARALDRLNLTSPEATTRMGEYVNDRYKEVTSGIGLQTSRIDTEDVTVNTTNYPDLPEMVFGEYEKITKIMLVDGASAVRTLREQTYDEITSVVTNTELPRAYAVKRLGPSSVTVVLDSYDPVNNFTLRVEGYVPSSTLSGSDEPDFPEDFHDILIWGAMADELRKMEKYQLAADRENKFQQRLSDMRMFIAKSGYLDIAQGKDKPSQTWYRPWYSRITTWG